MKNAVWDLISTHLGDGFHMFIQVVFIVLMNLPGISKSLDPTAFLYQFDSVTQRDDE